MPRLADRRAKIDLLRAAEAAFTEHGLAAAKVEDITARAGVSKGAFYLHFESKEDCFRQIIEGFLARLASSIEIEEQVTALGSLAEMRARWQEHNRQVFEFCWQNRALLAMIMSGGGGAPFGYLIDELAERVAKQTEASVRMAQEAGLYRADIEPSVVAALISGAYDRLARDLVKQPKRPDIEAWSRQVLDLFLEGLLVERAAKGMAKGAAKKVRGRAERPRSGAAKVKVTDQRVTSARRRRAKASGEGKTGMGAR